MKNDKIQQANRKALPKFLALLLVSMVLGGILGFCASYYGFNEFTEKLAAAGAFFCESVAHWLLLALVIALPAVCVPMYNRAKKEIENWDGEDETVSEQAEEKISLVMWLSGAAQIVAYFLIAASYTAGSALLAGNDNRGLLALSLGVVGLLAVMAENMRIQQKSVDLTKRLYPEQTASVYDMRFRKKWVEGCDEAEKIMIGKCAYKAYTAASYVCSGLGVLFALTALIFGTGFLPSLAVCVIWLVMHSVYCRESIRLSKAGCRITE